MSTILKSPNRILYEPQHVKIWKRFLYFCKSHLEFNSSPPLTLFHQKSSIHLYYEFHVSFILSILLKLHNLLYSKKKKFYFLFSLAQSMWWRKKKNVIWTLTKSNKTIYWTTVHNSPMLLIMKTAFSLYINIVLSCLYWRSHMCLFFGVCWTQKLWWCCCCYLNKHFLSVPCEWVEMMTVIWCVSMLVYMLNVSTLTHLSYPYPTHSQNIQPHTQPSLYRKSHLKWVLSQISSPSYSQKKVKWIYSESDDSTQKIYHESVEWEWIFLDIFIFLLCSVLHEMKFCPAKMMNNQKKKNKKMKTSTKHMFDASLSLKQKRDNYDELDNISGPKSMEEWEWIEVNKMKRIFQSLHNLETLQTFNRHLLLFRIDALCRLSSSFIN